MSMSWVSEARTQVEGNETIGAALEELAAATGESGSAWVDRRDLDFVRVYLAADGALHRVEGTPLDPEATDASYTAEAITHYWTWRCRVERTIGAGEGPRAIAQWAFNTGQDETPLVVEYAVGSDDPAAAFARALASQITAAHARAA
jgi:hypothetical protein